MTATASSFPFFSIARKHDIPYATVLGGAEYLGRILSDDEDIAHHMQIADQMSIEIARAVLAERRRRLVVSA